jgi:DNA repair exonuclease SbcCD ATPase subunit
LSVEFLKELELLEDRFDSLARLLGELKAENAALREASSGVEGLRGENEGLRGENEELKRQVEGLRAEAGSQREKMDAAAERVRGLIARLDSAR